MCVQILNVAPKKWDAIVQCATSCLSGNSSSNLSDFSSPNTPGFDSQQFFVPPVYYGMIYPLLHVVYRRYIFILLSCYSKFL